MRTVISKRLYNVVHSETEVKINGETFLVQFNPEVRDEDCDNYILYREAVEFNYFCYNSSSKITCWPISKGEQPLTDNGKWKREGRQELKAGRFMQMMSAELVIFNRYYEQLSNLSTDVHDKVVRRACELFAERLVGVNQPIRFVESTNIASVYNMQSHQGSGYLRNSCMRSGSGYGCRYHAEFYEHIPNLSIVHQIDGGELLFRALLWRDAYTKVGEPVTFLDRIYGTDSVNNQLIDTAIERGWAWRSFGNNEIHLGDNLIFLHKHISEAAFNYAANEGIPYLDTLHGMYVSKENGIYTIANYNYGNYEKVRMQHYHLQDCDGNPVAGIKCPRCGHRVDENDLVDAPNGYTYCAECYAECFVTCEDCNEDISRSEVVYYHHVQRDHLCETVYCRDCARDRGMHCCHRCDEWGIENDMHSVPEIGRWYCHACFRFEARTCAACGTVQHRRLIKVGILNDSQCWLCTDCYNDAPDVCHRCKVFIPESTMIKCGEFNYCKRCAAEKLDTVFRFLISPSSLIAVNVNEAATEILRSL